MQLEIETSSYKGYTERKAQKSNEYSGMKINTQLQNAVLFIVTQQSLV
jgi:hypothetical protein